MPRSAILPLLRRWYAVRARSGEHGPVAQGASSRATWSRRAALRGGLLCAAAGALGCSVPATRPATRGGPTVAIVGAGAAGLSCGWQLRRAGIDVRIYDARSRVGGRIHTSRGAWGDGLSCELGGELIGADHLAIRGLCHALDLPLDDLCEDTIDADGVHWFHGERRSTAQLADAFTPIAEAIARAHRRVGTLALTHRTPGPAASLDAMSLSEWLDDAGATGWFRALLEASVAAQLGLDAGEQSALSFLMTFAGVEPRAFDPMFEREQRFRVRGGNDRLTTALADALPGRIQLERALEAVRPDGAAYRLTFARGAGLEDVRADAVVLALPFATLRDVALDVPLPEVKRRAIAELGYGTGAKLAVGFRERVWRARGETGSVLTDLAPQSIWDATRGQPGRAGVLVSCTGGRAGIAMGEGETRAHADAFAATVDAIFPGLAPLAGTAERVCWPSVAWSQGSYSCYRPGQHAAFGGVPAEPVERLFFAGEHTAVRHIGFMEGACESGLRAAREVLLALGLSAVEAPAAPVVDPDCR
jgi:monoamine oxidase